MTNWLCWLGFHRWQLMRRDYNDGETSGTKIYDVKECQSCGAIKK